MRDSMVLVRATSTEPIYHWPGRYVEEFGGTYLQTAGSGRRRGFAGNAKSSGRGRPMTQQERPMDEIAESAFGGDLETVSRWVMLRCWALHWWKHRQETDTGVTVRYCPRCCLVVSVLHKGEAE